jgi:hypothetical protein
MKPSNLKPPAFKKEWRFYLKWIGMGLIAASVIKLINYYR